jgi:hypothetical protein
LAAKPATCGEAKLVPDIQETGGRRFNRWLEDETQDAMLVVKNQTFIQTAAIRLAERTASVTSCI